MNNTLLRLRILIIDDVPEHAERLKRMLAKLDCDFLIATTAAEALQLIRKPENIYNPVDVAIIDYFIPGTNGTSLGKQLQDLDQDLNILILTSDGSREVSREVLSSGIKAAGFISKQEDIEVLISALQYLLANKRWKLENKHSFLKERTARYGAK